MWVGIYHRVANPAIAAEVIQHLDADADLKRTHSALYLRCKESLRQKKARQARTKRVRSFMRRIFGRLLRDPTRNTRPPLRRSAGVVIEGAPESMRESAQHSVKSVPKTAELTAAQPDCGGHPNALRASTPRLDGSAAAPPDAKAA
jgi:hypothetical protein